MSRSATRKARQPSASAPPPPQPRADWAFLLRSLGMIGGLLLLALIAMLLFRTRLTVVGGSEMAWDRAVFFSINAVTLGGFHLPINPGDLKPFGQIVEYLLIVSATMIYLLIGGWSLRRICNYATSDRAIAQQSVILFVLATLCGGSLLLGNGIGLFQSLFDASAAFGNCGLFIGRLPEIASLKVQAVLLPLATLGGLGVPVLVDAWQSLTHRRRMNEHTGAALTSAAVVYLLAIALLMIFESLGSATSAVATAGTLAINTRTLGFPQDLITLGVATPWLLMILMAVGASSGGSGGGIKSNTFWLLIRDAWRVVCGRTATPIFAVALLAVAIYSFLVLLTVIGLSIAQPSIAGEQLLLAAFSAVSNCGLSRQPINFTGGALYILALAMLAGRLASLLLLLLCASLRIESDVAVA